VTTILTAIVTLAIIIAIKHFSNRPPVASAAGDRLTLKMHWLYSAIGFVSVGLGLLILILAWEQLNRDAEGRKTILMLVALFAGLGGVLINDSRSRVTLTPDAIEAFSAWRGAIHIPWTDVASISFSLINGWFVVRSNSGATIRVSSFFVGIKAFVAAAKLNLPSTVYGDVFRRFGEK
jgi:hypothetical protein